MSKLVKELITKELKSRYGEIDNAIWIEMIGVDGITTNEFRGDLRGQDVRVEVVKNSLFQRACASGPLAPLAEALDGPAAILTGGESPINVAKVLDDWKKKIKSLRIRGAVLDGEYLDEGQVKNLSKMPTREDMQAKLSATVLSPGGNLAAAILSGGGNIAGCLKALIEKLEKDETPQAA